MSGESLQFTAFPVFNGYAPKSGPLALPLNIDFTTDPSQEFDFVAAFQNGTIDYIQSVWIDLNAVNHSVSFTFAPTQQRLIVPANTQGVYPVLSGSPVKFTAILTGGAAAEVARLIFLNVPMATGSWGP